MVNQILAVFVPILIALPGDALASIPRVGGFPGQTKIRNHIYHRHTFNHLTREVGEAPIIPNPRVTLREHERRALSEHEHLGEAWVQAGEYESSLLLNTSAGNGLYSHYYEGADGPVPDLQESRAAVFLPELRQKVYRELALANPDCTGGLLPLASTCRLLRSEIIAFQRASFAFAFRHPTMLQQFLQCNEPGNVLLRHKEKILILGCVLIDLRQHEALSPVKTTRLDFNTKRQVDLERHGDKVLDMIDEKIGKLSQGDRRYVGSAELTDWVEPMLRLLKGWKVQKLVVRRENGTEYLFDRPELVECLLGFISREKRAVVFDNVGGWNWHALEYDIITVKNPCKEDDEKDEDHEFS